MRILQLTTSTQRRGAEVFAHQLGEELGRRGHAVHTIALSGSDEPAALPFEVLGGTRAGPGTLRSLARSARSDDVVIAHGGASLVPAAISSAVARRPFVYRNIGDPAHWGAVRGANLRVGAPLRRAAAVVALYRGARSYMVERYGLDPNRVAVASNAVDVDLFPERDADRRARARTALDLDGGGALIGYLGALSPEKRPEWVLEVARRLPNATALIAGDGPLRTELAAAAPGNVRFLGSVGDPPGFLAALDVLVVPSRTEGVPGVLLEAALTGVPVVATDVGGVAEVAGPLSGVEVVGRDDLTGFTAAVGHALASGPATTDDRHAIQERHSMPRIADTWERVLREVVAPRR